MRVVRGDEPLFSAPEENAPRRGAARLGAHLPVYAARSGGGCTEPWFHVGPAAWVCGAGVEPSEAPALGVDARTIAHRNGLPYGYYFVDELGALGYRDLNTAEWGAPDLELEPGFAIAIARTAERPTAPPRATAWRMTSTQAAAPRADPFGLTPHGFWVPLRDLRPARPSVFQGRAWPADPAAKDGSAPRGMAPESLVWTTRDRVALHGAPGGRILRRVGRHVPFTVLERRVQGRTAWLRLKSATDTPQADTPQADTPHADAPQADAPQADTPHADAPQGRAPQEEPLQATSWVRQADVARIVPAPPPAQLEPGERWIDVDLTEQVLTAYEGERLVFATLVSTGRGRGAAEDATPLGEHRIWVKLVASDMNNLEASEANRYYSMQSVPWVMYFHRGYGLHGAYWHDDFGQRRSHGCVNLSPPDAARLFQWAEPRLPAGWSAILPSRYERGTLVRVRESGKRTSGGN